MADVKNAPRLKELYNKELKAKLQKELDVQQFLLYSTEHKEIEARLYHQYCTKMYTDRAGKG